MRVVAYEEHLLLPEVLDAWTALPPSRRDLAFGPSSSGETGRRLLDTGAERLDAMDATGVDVQVLSLATPGLQNLDAADAVRLQERVNDAIAAVVRHRPDRFRGLAALATGDPDRAAAELDRAVTGLGLEGAMLYGRTGDTSLDDPRFEPILAAAESLGVPLHLHPASPPTAVRHAYYEGLTPGLADAFATHGIGWHIDAGVQLLRLVLAGVLDRHPRLQLVIGHWGEAVVLFLERVEHLAAPAGLELSIEEYFRRHVHVTPSGMLSDRYLRWVTDVVGADRLLFATDYPFERASTSGARAFLDAAPLADVDREAFASVNGERLHHRAEVGS